MTRVELLRALKDFTLSATENVRLPTKTQERDYAATTRTPAVYLMRLPDGKSSTKVAPYILHTVATGSNMQPEGSQPISSTTIRSIFCVYAEDEQAGGLMLLELMECMRIELMRKCVLADQFELDLSQGMEDLIYPDDTAPFYLGEILTHWNLPAIRREVKLW